jgi:hypothetical protein
MSVLPPIGGPPPIPSLEGRTGQVEPRRCKACNRSLPSRVSTVGFIRRAMAERRHLREAGLVPAEPDLLARLGLGLGRHLGLLLPGLYLLDRVAFEGAVRRAIKADARLAAESPHGRAAGRDTSGLPPGGRPVRRGSRWPDRVPGRSGHRSPSVGSPRRFRGRESLWILLANSRQPSASKCLGRMDRSAKGLSPATVGRDEFANRISNGKENRHKALPD